MSDRSWKLSTTADRLGGLEFRAPDAHASAAYQASFFSSADLAGRIDAQFDPADTADSSGICTARHDFNLRVGADDQLLPASMAKVQRLLSESIDRAILAGLRADLSWGDHALVCPCRGDRTVRHNVIRDLVYQEARDAGCAPEKEKGHLLPGRSLEDGAPPRHDAPPNSEERRRPADIWLPRGVGERVAGPAALDFAITSGLRADRVERAKEVGQAIADDYAAVKRAHLDTGQKCQVVFCFLSLVSKCTEASSKHTNPKPRVRAYVGMAMPW